MNKIINSVILITMASISLHANWQLVENFDAFGDEWLFACRGAYGNTGTAEDPSVQGCGLYEIITDPIAGAGNTVGMFRAAELNVVEADGTYAILFFPEEVGLEYNEFFTVYFRFAIEDFRQDTVFGTAFVDNTSERLGERYGGYNAGFRVTTSQGGNLEVHNNGYQGVTSEPLDLSTWYEVWVVHNHDHDLDNNPLAQTYNVYIKGGEFTERILLVENAWYRNTEGVVRSFVINQSTGPTANPFGNSALFLDDLYIDYTGENLDPPPGEGEHVSLWDGYEVINQSKLTGALGWIVDTSYPWVFSYALNSWVYIYPNGKLNQFYFYNWSTSEIFLGVESYGGWAYRFGANGATEGWINILSD